MKQNPFALIVGGRDGIDPEKMHEYAKKVLEAEGIPYFEFNYDVLVNELPARNYEYNDEEELYESAKQLVVMQQRASTAFLQSRLQIGYMKANRVMDRLEKEGIVSGSKGSAPREVFYEKSDKGGIRKKKRNDKNGFNWLEIKK